MIVSQGAGSGELVLVVEDDTTTAEIFGLTLREAGYRVQLAGDAESALGVVERVTPAAMILDLRLPAMNGLELLRQIRTHAEPTPFPVAVVTGDYFIDEAIVAEFKALGAQVFFKPIWHEELTKIVGDLLSGPQVSH